MGFLTKYRHVIVCFFVIAPIFVCLSFIKGFGINVPLIDQWYFVPLFDKLYTGHLTLWDLAAPYYGEPMLLSRVVMLVFGSVTHYNVLAELYFNWLLVCVVFFILLRAYIKAFGLSDRTLLQCIPVGWLLFSLRQAGNILWGWQMWFYLTSVFAVSVFYLLSSSRKIDFRFVLSIMGAVIATFSSGAGIFLWPIGLLQIVLIDDMSKDMRLKKGVVWCLAALAVLAAYVSINSGVEGRLGAAGLISRPLSSIVFLLVVLGGPLGWEKPAAFASGIFLVLFYAGAMGVINQVPRRLRFLVSLILFSCVAAVAITLVRGRLGLDTAIQSRYTTLATLGIIGAYLIIAGWFNERRHDVYRVFVYGFFIAIIANGIISAYSFGTVRVGGYMKTYAEKALSIVRAADALPDEAFLSLWPDRADIPGVMREGVTVLKKYGLSDFYGHSAGE